MVCSSAKESRKKRVVEKQQFPKNCLGNPLSSQKSSAELSLLAKPVLTSFVMSLQISLCLAAAQVETMRSDGG